MKELNETMSKELKENMSNVSPKREYRQRDRNYKKELNKFWS